MGSIYRAFGLEPNKSARNMLTEQTFTATAQSQISDYKVRIYRISDNTLLYEGSKISLVTPLYATQELVGTVPITGALATERDIKWTLEVWNGADSALSKETPFTNYEPPLISLVIPPTITEQSYQFVGLYSQNQGIQVARFRYTLYDATQKVIEQTDWIPNTSLIHTFSNFLDGSVYYARCELYDEQGQYADTSLMEFAVDYDEPSVSFVPTVENIKNSAAIAIKWIGAYVLEGVLVGTAYFVENFLYFGNNGININSGSSAYWENVNIEEEFTTSMWWQPNSSSFDGVIFKQESTESGEIIEVGYSQTMGSFYRENLEGTDYVLPIPINATYAYLLILVGTQLTVKEYS